jgi:hypothetical protein
MIDGRAREDSACHIACYQGFKVKLIIWAMCNSLNQHLGLAAKVILFLCFVQQNPQSLVLDAIFS